MSTSINLKFPFERTVHFVAIELPHECVMYLAGSEDLTPILDLAESLNTNGNRTVHTETFPAKCTKPQLYRRYSHE